MAEEEAKRRSRTIVWLKFLYLWQAVGPSSWGRFASLYYDSVHLSPSQIGMITGSMPMVRAVAMPAWGWCADKISSKKRVALTTQAVGASFLLLLLVPTVSRSFVHIWLISILSACFASSGVLDAFTLQVLGPKEKSRFGEIRLWSAVSWGVCNFLMGYVADLMHGNFIVNILIFFVCTMISTLILAFVIPDDKAVKPRIKEEDPPLPLLEEEGSASAENVPAKKLSIGKKVSLAVFFFELFIIGAGMGLVERLLFVYIVEVLGGSYTLCGLTVVATVSLEIPLFAYAKWILTKIGHEACFLLALACYVPRVLGYTLLTKETKHWIILIEIAHGVTFGLMFSAAVDKAADLAPPGREATFQTIQNACRGCLGSGIGAILGGWYWQYVCTHRGKQRENCRAGGVKLFRLAAAIFSVVLFLHLISLVYLKIYNFFFRCYTKQRRQRQAKRNNHDDDDDDDHETASVLRALRTPLLDIEEERTTSRSSSSSSSTMTETL